MCDKFICIFQHYSTLKHKLLQGSTFYNWMFDAHQPCKSKTFADQAALIHPHKHDLFFVWPWERSCWGRDPPKTGLFLNFIFGCLSLEPWGSSILKVVIIPSVAFNQLAKPINNNLMRASQKIQWTSGNSTYNSMMDELLDRGGCYFPTSRFNETIRLVQTRRIFVFVMSNSWQHLEASILSCEINLSRAQ